MVSAMGADAKSRVFYNRVKGEVEEALARLPFEGLVIARPSLLLGDREALGQPLRPAERVGMAVGRLLGPLIPAHYRPIVAAAVARALLVIIMLVSNNRKVMGDKVNGPGTNVMGWAATALMFAAAGMNLTWER